MRLLGLMAGLVAMLVVLAAGPGHVLEEVGHPHHIKEAASVLARADAHLADWDHHIHGHDCADHCAAHVLTIAPQSPQLTPSPVVRAAWRAPTETQGRSVRLKTPTRPPRV